MNFNDSYYRVVPKQHRDWDDEGPYNNYRENAMHSHEAEAMCGEKDYSFDD